MDGLTDEERCKLEKVKKVFNFEVKTKNKIMGTLSTVLEK